MSRGCDRQMGQILLGEKSVGDWRQRAQRGTARVRGYYDVHPDRESSLDARCIREEPLRRPTAEDRASSRTPQPSPAAASRGNISSNFSEVVAQAGNGKVLNTGAGNYLDHPAGGCRMGADPASSVCDSFGQTHDHENLFVAGSPTLPNAGCTNGTLTFVALTLRSAKEIARGFRA